MYATTAINYTGEVWRQKVQCTIWRYHLRWNYNAPNFTETTQ